MTALIPVRCDVAVIGGGIVGSATAYFIKRLAPACDVAVVEPDPTYEFASTLRASGGARRQFSCPENIAMSNFSIPFIARADEELSVDGEPAHVEWREGGYPFEACRCRRTWSGLYEQNELDGNPVIGNWPEHVETFYVVAGFSGHGMMHAPAAGRAIAELIVHGRFETLDLARLGYRCIAESAPYPERGIL